MNIKTSLFSIVLLLITCAAYASEPHLYELVGIDGYAKENIIKRLDAYLKQLPQPLTEASIETFIKHAPKEIENALQPYGYFKPQIHHGLSDRTTILVGKRTLRHLFRAKLRHRIIIFYIKPGPVLKINSVQLNVTGSGRHYFVKQINEFPLKANQPFNADKYNSAKQTLFDTAEHNGFLKARFLKAQVKIDLARYTCHITLHFDTKEQFHFGRITYSPTYLSKQFLKRYQSIQTGQAYSTQRVLSFNNALLSSGYFKNVVVTPDITDSLSVPVDVHLQQKARRTYQLGIGYGTDTGPRGRVGINITPTNTYGHKFTLVGQGSFQQSALQAQYLVPGKKPLIDSYALTASVYNLDYATGYANSGQLSLASLHKKEHHQRTLALTVLYERYNYTATPRENQFLAYPNALFVWKDVSSPLFSPNGYNLTVTGLAGTKAVGSKINFGQAEADLRAAYKFKPTKTRFYGHITQGILGIKDVDSLPLSLAFLLGGNSNLRAYNLNSIGPGKRLSFGSVEIQQETKENWYAVGFYDIGDVYNRKATWQRDAGVMLMWVSPVGPIKIGIARRINERFSKLPGSKVKFVLNMGPDL